MTSLFLEPLDVLFLRGNKLFGDPGSHGEAQMPSNPSVAAGALRSRILADAGIDLAAFAQGKIAHPTLGTPSTPGAFTLTAFHLARRNKSGGHVELFFAPPADLVLNEKKGQKFPKVTMLKPTALAVPLQTSAPLPLLPVLAQENREKPVSGWWLTISGWAAVLRGKLPNQETHWVKTADLWSTEDRVGIGMSAATHSVETGKIFTTQAIVFQQGIGFLARIEGADAPTGGSLRFGGDGRAVAIHPAETILPDPDYPRILQEKRCRLILTAPGIFAEGWLPTGTRQEDGNGVPFGLHGVRARLVAAAVPRFATVSGWDLAQWRPKTAERVAPTGSVYWMEDIQAEEVALKRLVAKGLWQAPDENPTRRAEGFNRCVLANGHGPKRA
jgi:CRISPR-associated protein Cmr3